jgi:hypothetical protein
MLLRSHEPAALQIGLGAMAMQMGNKNYHHKRHYISIHKKGDN